MKKSIPALTAILILLILLTHPKTAFDGACQGLVLWSQTVLPTLLPFMICSNGIVMLGGIPILTAPFRFFLLPLFGLSDAGCYVLISGLLCGYPMGAKTCSEFLDQGRISLSEARRLLAISNHPSPMFLLGYTASVLSSQVPVSWLMLSLYLPILPLSLLANVFYGEGRENKRNISGMPGVSAASCAFASTNAAAAADTSAAMYVSAAPSACATAATTTGASAPSRRRSFDDMMMSSVEVMVRIGGYIMLFSILAVFIRQTPVLPDTLKALALGFVEITTGIQAIGAAFSGHLQGLCLAAVTAFGGLSGIFQTKSVLKNAGLSIRHYVLWKLAHTACSCLIYLALLAAAGLS